MARMRPSSIFMVRCFEFNVRQSEDQAVTFPLHAPFEKSPVGLSSAAHQDRIEPPASRSDQRQRVGTVELGGHVVEEVERCAVHMAKLVVVQ